jgi:hypothetical protein
MFGHKLEDCTALLHACLPIGTNAKNDLESQSIPNDCAIIYAGICQRRCSVIHPLHNPEASQSINSSATPVTIDAAAGYKSEATAILQDHQYICKPFTRFKTSWSLSKTRSTSSERYPQVRLMMKPIRHTHVECHYRLSRA